MDLGLNGRTVVVTGGTGALGRAVVSKLLAEGARPVVTWRSERELRDFPSADRVRAEKLDLADENAVNAFYRGLGAKAGGGGGGGLWASVHLAGGFAMKSVADTSAADFLGMFATNALSCFLCCREAVRAIRKSAGGNGEGGRIVNVAARPAVTPVAGLSAYAASKAAVANLTLTLAEELAAEQIWVNAVLPSTMDTPANRKSMPDADFAKWPKLDEVAATIAFLASPQNAVTRGALAPVYGQS